jgi:CRP-like cAMP-binding protein
MQSLAAFWREPDFARSDSPVAGTPKLVAAGTLILAPGPCSDCFLIESGLVSVRFGIDSVEVGLVGPGAMLNFGAVLGSSDLTHPMVAMTDCRLLQVSGSTLERLCRQHPPLRAQLARHLHSRMMQTMALAACPMRPSLEQRLASWIVAATALLGRPELRVTHQQLSTVLGVRRPSLTLALQALETRQAIRSRRNCVLVRDREQLGALACGCMSAAEPHAGELCQEADRFYPAGTIGVL